MSSKKKPGTCPECGKTLSDTSHVRRHLREVHKKNPPDTRKFISWKKCLSCNRQMRSERSKKEDHPGTVRHHTGGYCTGCYIKIWARKKKHRERNCTQCDRPLRPRGVLAKEWPGTMAYAANGMCHTCWENVKRSKNAHYIPADQRIDLTAAAQVRRLVEARYTGEQRKYMLDILGIGGGL